MKQIGLYLVIFGAGSMILNLFDYEFRLLMWVDTWGPTVGWGMRSALVAVGAVMFFLGGQGAQQGAR